jgi:hypothetical protein
MEPVAFDGTICTSHVTVDSTTSTTDEMSAPVVGMSKPVSISVGRILVGCTPVIRDPSEMYTIVVSSIRSLFGELESHSFGMEVKASSSSLSTEMEYSDNDDKSSSYHFIIECDEQSVDAIRASLTMATTNQFGSNTVYRFDVIE